MSDRKCDTHTVRRIAVESLTHPSTVERYLNGDPVRRLSAQSIETALRGAGLDRLVRSEVSVG